MTDPDGEATLDAFHRGAFHVVQPARGGHRSGMDAMMLAAAVPGGFAGTLVDLGAGAGAAGLAVASRCPGAQVLLVERSPLMAGYARRSAGHPTNARLTGRVAVLEADVTLTGRTRVAAGLADAAFDYAILNPPFNEGRDRPSPDALRRDAHVMQAGLLESWIRTAAAVLRPGGGVALIARPQSLDGLVAALKGRFGGCRIVPVLPRTAQAAIRIIVRGTRGSRAALSIEPPLVLHGDAGHAYASRAERICNGQESLFGD
jgi:tRNA1(Val) A37 N6-methylase TrmN6